MRKLLFLVLCSIFIISSCSKSSSGGGGVPPGNPNNQVNATVSIKGGTPFSLTSSGNSTIFAKRTDPNGDYVITVLGSGSQGSVHLTLVNITSAASYSYSMSNPAQYAFCTYEIGNALTGPFELYSTSGAASGSLLIQELTSTSIKGTFTATCSNTTGMVQITSGSFTGSF